MAIHGNLHILLMSKFGSESFLFWLQRCRNMERVHRFAACVFCEPGCPVAQWPSSRR